MRRDADERVFCHETDVGEALSQLGIRDQSPTAHRVPSSKVDYHLVDQETRPSIMVPHPSNPHGRIGMYLVVKDCPWGESVYYGLAVPPSPFLPSPPATQSRLEIEKFANDIKGLGSIVEEASVAHERGQLNELRDDQEEIRGWLIRRQGRTIRQGHPVEECVWQRDPSHLAGDKLAWS